MSESTKLDYKSLKVVTGNNPDWDELAKDCVCFANAKGGEIIIGIEDGETEPPADQTIDPTLSGKIQQRIQERTINVGVVCYKEVAENDSEIIFIKVNPSIESIAATTNGKYYTRVGDECKPLAPDELTRLMTDKPTFIWELKHYLKVHYSKADSKKFETFILDVRSSDRVSKFVSGKSPEELLKHFNMIDDEGYLNNLGVLWLGTAN